MKKTKRFIFIIFCFSLIFSPAALAQNEKKDQQRAQKETIAEDEFNPSGNKVTNENQIRTQNEGEEEQLQVATQEQENLQEEEKTGSQNRSSVARGQMSSVAEKVEELLLWQDDSKEGIGEQIREVAREQNQTQLDISNNLTRLESRSGLLLTLFGPDYKAIENLEQNMEKNRLRIRILEQLQDQVTSEEDKTLIQETIQAIISENTALEEQIQNLEQTNSVFGWFLKLFVKQ